MTAFTEDEFRDLVNALWFLFRAKRMPPKLIAWARKLNAAWRQEGVVAIDLPDGPSRMPSTPTMSGGFVPRGKQRMAAGVSKATGNAQDKLEYGIERHEAALGRG